MSHAKELLVRTREFGLPLIEDLEAQGGETCGRFDAIDDNDEFVQFLDDDPQDRCVANLTSSTDMHAEQTTLLGRCLGARQLDRSTQIAVAGTFRPCRGCFESLTVKQRHRFSNLQFGSRPGHDWKTTNQAHVDILPTLQGSGDISPLQSRRDFDSHGLLIGLTNTSHRPPLRMRDGDDVDRLHWASDSESNVSSDEDH